MQAVRGYAAKGSTDEHVEVFSFIFFSFQTHIWFSGRYSLDKLEHHTTLNLELIFYFF